MPLPALSMSIVAFAQHLAVAIGLLAAGQVMRDASLRMRTMDSLSGGTSTCPRFSLTRAAYAHLTASSLALIDAIPTTLALTPTRATITVTSVPRTIPVAQPARTVFITAAQVTRAPTALASPLSTSVQVSGPAAAEHARARWSEPPSWSFWHAILVAIVLDSLGYAFWLTRKHHLDPAARALLASSRPVILRGVNWSNSHGILSVRHTMLVAQAAITRRRQIDALAAKDTEIAVAAGKLLYTDSILAQRTAQLMAVTFALDTEAGRTRAVADELDTAIIDRDNAVADRTLVRQQLSAANVQFIAFQGQLAAAQVAASQAQQAEAVAQQAEAVAQQTIQRLQTDLANTTASRNEVSAELVKRTVAHSDLERELVAARHDARWSEDAAVRAQETIRRLNDNVAAVTAARADVEAKARQDGTAHAEAMVALQEKGDLIAKQLDDKCAELSRAQTDLVTAANRIHVAERKLSPLTAALAQAKEEHRRDMALAASAQRDAVSEVTRRCDVKIASVIADRDAAMASVVAERDAAVASITKERDGKVAACESIILEYKRKIGALVTDRDRTVAALTVVVQRRETELRSTVAARNLAVGALTLVIGQREKTLGSAIERGERKVTELVRQHVRKVRALVVERNDTVAALAIALHRFLATSEETRDRLQDELMAALSVRAVLATGLARAEQRSQELASSLAAALADRRDSQANFAAVQQQLGQARDNAIASVATITTQRDAALASVDAIKTERDNANAAIATLTTDRDTALTSVATITTERDIANASVVRLTSQRNAAVVSIVTLRQQHDDAVASVNTITQQLAAAQSQIVALQASPSYADLKADNTALESKIKRARVELDRAVAQGKSASIKAFGFGRCFGSLPIDASTLVAVKLGPELVSRAPATRAQLARWHPDRLSGCDPTLRTYSTALSQVLSQALDAGGLVDRVVDFNTALNRGLNSAYRVFPDEELDILIQGFREHHAEVRAQTLRVDGKEDEAAEPMTDTEELILVLLALEPWRVRYPGMAQFSPLTLPAADRQRWRSPRCEVAGPPPSEQATPLKEDPMDTT